VRDATVTNGLERLLLFAGRGQRDTGPPPGDFDVVTRKIEVTR
jgi:hypothetical protein